ncbi:MAG: PD40 domain-containing protein [Deltaproteobacteria bacterium]|nr:PD40 domain-containing protein [Deltaproteobacteria bacterium]
MDPDVHENGRMIVHTGHSSIFVSWKLVYFMLASLCGAAAIASCTGRVGEGFQHVGNVYLTDFSREAPSIIVDARQSIDAILSAVKRDQVLPGLDILDPYDGTIFPPDMAQPRFRWMPKPDWSFLYLVESRSLRSGLVVYVLTDKSEWEPSEKVWTLIKDRSMNTAECFTVYALGELSHDRIVAKGSVTFTTSTDPLGSPVMYIQLPLPFSRAKQSPGVFALKLGDVASRGKPRTVLSGMNACMNCHALSSDGRLFGIDIDYRGDKGGYIVKEVASTMVIGEEDIISWNDVRRSDGIDSAGFFSRISPDGKFIVSTVKEKPFFTMIPDIEFSQFFFPVTGLIAFYDVEKKQFSLLPGASDPDYVQTCPEWSPDGNWIVFARTKRNPALESLLGDKRYITIEPHERIRDLNKKYRIHFELCRIPFNGGKGGSPLPLAGASGNGMSNYFPRWSPDGRWIVFTQSPTGLAIQPESKLVIIPAEGGNPRTMQCNTDIMNSWHSWSPNGRWLVFSSKANSPYTELFLTHVDEDGNDSPPVILSRFSSSRLACVAPEIVNIPEGAMDSVTFSGSREQPKYIDPNTR